MIFRVCSAVLGRNALALLFAICGAVACSDASGDLATGGTSAGVGGSSASIGGSSPLAGASGKAPSAGHSSSVGGAAVGGSRAAAGGTAGAGGAKTAGPTTAGATSGGGSGAVTGSSSGLGGDGAASGAVIGGTAGNRGSGVSAGENSRGGAGAGGAGAGGRAAGGAGAGNSDAGSGYQACPSRPCKIMPFGDSITFGVGDEGNGGYRGPLFAAIITAGQKVTFTGSLSNGPSMVSNLPFPPKNEGHSGWGISRITPYSGNNAGIATVIPNPGFSGESGGVPDIILLHIGTNDQGSLSASQMTSDLSGLLDKLITNAPNAYIVVAQIIPLGYGDNAVIKAYNQSIPALVHARASAGKHVALVDMFTGFTPSMLASDKVHPNRTGYAFMAERWYSAIGDLLPE